MTKGLDRKSKVAILARDFVQKCHVHYARTNLTEYKEEMFES